MPAPNQPAYEGSHMVCRPRLSTPDPIRATQPAVTTVGPARSAAPLRGGPTSDRPGRPRRRSAAREQRQQQIERRPRWPGSEVWLSPWRGAAGARRSGSAAVPHQSPGPRRPVLRQHQQRAPPRPASRRAGSGSPGATGTPGGGGPLPGADAWAYGRNSRKPERTKKTATPTRGWGQPRAERRRRRCWPGGETDVVPDDGERPDHPDGVERGQPPQDPIGNRGRHQPSRGSRGYVTRE